MQYAALLRGIGPGNPDTKNEKLKAAFESAGFTNVQTIISSGNLIFESRLKDTARLETRAEKALSEKLGLTKNFVVIRSREELEGLVKKNPFKGKGHGEDFYLLITFFKDRTKAKDGYIASAIPMKSIDGPKLMADLEKKHGKQITSRTWLTLQRIVRKFDSLP